MPAQPEIIRIGQLEIHCLQEAHGACEASCFEMCVPPGSNVPPPHSHSEHEELIYALEGTLRCTVGGAVVNAGGPPDRTKLMATMNEFGLVLAVPATAPAP